MLDTHRGVIESSSSRRICLTIFCRDFFLFEMSFTIISIYPRRPFVPNVDKLYEWNILNTYRRANRTIGAVFCSGYY